MAAVRGLSGFVNLTDVDFLAANCLDPSFDLKVDAKPLEQMFQIAQRMYESAPKLIANASFSYPSTPELLLSLAGKVRGRVFLEIAAGFGDHGLFLALAGAKKVYVNDNCPEAISAFNLMKAKIVPEASEKIETIAGDAFKLFEMKPDLKADLILCGNWIHFLTDEEQRQFFEMTKKILNVGGELVLTANGAYTPDVQLIHKTDPDATCFTLNQTMFFSRKPVSRDVLIAKIFSKYPEKSFERKPKNSVVYDKKSSGKWTLDQVAARNLSPEIYATIKSWVAENKEVMKQVTFGNLQNVENGVRLYTRETLAALLAQNGFSVSTTFVTDGKGHYLPEGEDPYGRADRTGAIATVNVEAAFAAVSGPSP